MPRMQILTPAEYAAFETPLHCLIRLHFRDFK